MGERFLIYNKRNGFYAEVRPFDMAVFFMASTRTHATAFTADEVPRALALLYPEGIDPEAFSLIPA